MRRRRRRDRHELMQAIADALQASRATFLIHCKSRRDRHELYYAPRQERFLSFQGHVRRWHACWNVGEVVVAALVQQRQYSNTAMLLILAFGVHLCRPSLYRPH